MENNFTGVVPDPESKKLPPVDPASTVPPGFTLEFTARGIPFLKKTDPDVSRDDDEAANEHKVETLSFFVSLDDIEKRFGMGTRLYFDFLKYVLITNAFLTVLALIHYIQFLAQRDFSTDAFEFEDLFVSKYPSTLRSSWIALNSIAIIFWFLFGPIYFAYIKKRLEKMAKMEHDNPYAFSGFGLDDIKANAHYTSTQRFWRRIGVYSLCLVLVCISGGITFGIQYSVREIRDSNGYIFWSFGITAAVTLINLIFVQISGRLTRFEKHKTWSLYRKHEGFKILAFRMVNVICMYVALQFAFTKSCCYFKDAGTKFLTLILTDLVINNFVEMFVPLFRIWGAKRFKCMQGSQGDEAAKPEFDVASEYLELFYRQFVIYLGMIVFPMMTLLGLITNIAEYPLDKTRMLKICQRPKRLDLSMKRFLVIWLVGVAAVALLCWPQGPVWVMSGVAIDECAVSCCQVLLPEIAPCIPT